MDYQSKLSDRSVHLHNDGIKEILAVLAKPGIISLAGGLPSPDAFPVQTIKELANKVLDEQGSKILQYNQTVGYQPLREALAQYIKRIEIDTLYENIGITTGSTSALNALGKILINPGDKVAVESPTYLGMLDAFNIYGAEYVGIDTDDQGILPLSLDKILREADIKLIYLVTNFQNPTGRTLPLERRKEVAEILKKHDVLAIEDDPYFELRYRGDHIPALKSLAPDHVIYLGSLSKVFAPSMRIGYYIAPEDIVNNIVASTQVTYLHANVLGQAIATEYINGGHLDKQLGVIRKLYNKKRTKLLDSLDEQLPEDFTYNDPDGGMFIWVKGPKKFDCIKTYKKAVGNGVAFVPGSFFYAQEGMGTNEFRLNFTNVGINAIEDAVGRMVEVL